MSYSRREKSSLGRVVVYMSGIVRILGVFMERCMR